MDGIRAQANQQGTGSRSAHLMSARSGGRFLERRKASGMKQCKHCTVAAAVHQSRGGRGKINSVLSVAFSGGLAYSDGAPGRVPRRQEENERDSPAIVPSQRLRSKSPSQVAWECGWCLRQVAGLSRRRVRASSGPKSARVYVCARGHPVPQKVTDE